MNRLELFAFVIVTTLITQVAVAANQFTVTLNNSANTAVLEDDGNPTNKIVQVRSTNGSFATIKFTMPTMKLVFDLGGGNDSLAIDGDLLNDPLPAVDILGRAGNDTVSIRKALINGNLTSTDTLGDNSLTLIGTTVTASASVTDGDGIQSLSFASQKTQPGVPFPNTVNGHLTVTSSGGGSNISLGTDFESGTGIFGGNVTIDNKGYGKDTIQFKGQVRGNLNMGLGNGDLNFNSIRSGVNGVFSWTKGSGVTNANLSEFDANDVFLTSYEGDSKVVMQWASIRKNLFISNGLGFDDITLNAVAGGTAASPALAVDINNGNGGSRLSMRNYVITPPSITIIRSLRLVNGDGADQVAIDLSERWFGDNQGVIRDLSINNGSGNSTFSVKGLNDRPVMDFVRVTNGSGFDTNTLLDTQIRSSLVLYNNDGGSDTDINNSRIGELNTARGDIVDLQSGLESDYLSVSNTNFAAPVAIMMGAGDDTLTLTQAWFMSAFDADAGSGIDLLAETLDNVYDAFYEATGFEAYFQF